MSTPAPPSATLQAIARSRFTTLLYRISRLLELVSMGRCTLRVYLFCAQPLGAPQGPTRRPDPGTSIQAVGPAHPLVGNLPRPAAVIRQRFAADARCRVALVKGVFAGMLWWSRGRHVEDEARCVYRLPGDGRCVWDFDVYVDPPFRLGRTLSRLWQAVDDELSAAGVRWSLSRITLFNTASVLSHARLGARLVGWGAFLQAGPAQLALFSQWPCVHLSLSPSAVPELALHPPAATRQDAEPVDQAVPEAALVLGLDSHGLAEARALGEAGITVYAAEGDLALPGCGSRHVQQVFPVTGLHATTLLRELLQIRARLSRHARVVLFPTDDAQVGLIARNMDLIAAHYALPWAGAAAELLQWRDKARLETLAPAPQAARPGDGETFFGAGVLDQGRVLHAMAGHGIAFLPADRGQPSVARTTDMPEVLTICQQVFQDSGLSGPASLTLQRDAAGRFSVTGLTVGRTDAWAQLWISAGFNQPAMAFELALGRTPATPTALQQVVWYDADRDPGAYLRQCRRAGSLRPWGIRQAFPYAGHRDTRPLLRASLGTLRRLARRVVPKAAA